jgi:SAM-dependent methyltransferase
MSDPDHSKNREFLGWAVATLKGPPGLSAEDALEWLTKPSLEQNVVALASTIPFRQKYPGVFRTVGPDAPKLRIDLTGTPDQMQRLHRHIRSTWERLGSTEPHWSVLSADRFTQKNLQQNKEEFYSSGHKNVLLIERILARYDIPCRFERAIEFGCGVGRVTVPLAAKCTELYAYDISEPHLQAARQLANEHGVKNIKFVRLSSPEDSIIGEADFLYSELVFQHNPPPIIRSIVAAALGSLRPGGVALFQVPTYRVNYTFDLKKYLSNIEAPTGEIEMHCIPQSEVFRIAEEKKCRVLEVRSLEQPVMRLMHSDRFVIRKNS